MQSYRVAIAVRHGWYMVAWTPGASSLAVMRRGKVTIAFDLGGRGAVYGV